jgi:hypothetical protein
MMWLWDVSGAGGVTRRNEIFFNNLQLHLPSEHAGVYGAFSTLLSDLSSRSSQLQMSLELGDTHFRRIRHITPTTTISEGDCGCPNFAAIEVRPEINLQRRMLLPQRFYERGAFAAILVITTISALERRREAIRAFPTSSHSRAPVRGAGGREGGILETDEGRLVARNRFEFLLSPDLCEA